MRLRILQTVAWFNIAAGAFLTCGSLLLAFAAFASGFGNQPLYIRGLFVLSPLCLALAFILTGKDFLKRPTQRSATVAASGFAILLCIILNSLFGRDPSAPKEDLIRFSTGIFIAYACFLALKWLVVRPLYVRRSA